MHAVPKSPNFGERRKGMQPWLIVLHATQMARGEEALAWLCNPTSSVSAHFFIGKKGKVNNLVPVQKRAWHAGTAHWQGCDDINSASIGIELDNNWVPYEAAQIEALIHLLKELTTAYAILPQNIMGHSDVAPNRKEDPGEHFPWGHLARAGLGLWPAHTAPVPEQTHTLADIHGAKACLARIGYNAQGESAYDLGDILRAFQQHFLPDNISGKLDEGTWRLIHQVAAAVPGKTGALNTEMH